jgi:hypothetical protein
VAVTATFLSVALPSRASASQGGPPGSQAENNGDDHHDVSAPLRDMAPAALVPRHEHPDQPLPAPPTLTTADPVVQRSAPAAAAPATGTNFDGVGDGFAGPAGVFSVSSAPPDTNGAVGPNHYVDLVNTSLAVFNKTGGVVYGPVTTNTVWSGFGGDCASHNDGDGIVRYDAMADRWVITQFAITTGGPYFQCVAVSTTPDPTGSYNRYAFSYANFPDYGKLGVWPDGYYVTFNMFNPAGTVFLGAKSCAYDRAKMLAGQAATQQCFDISPSYGAVLPSDLDGTTLPPPGAPNTQVGLGTTATTLASWRFHVDWTTPSNRTFIETDVLVASYAQACAGGTCIPQAGTSQQLDSLADRVMFRLAYRNFGDHESLVVNHSVNPGTGAASGVRWYELRLAGGVPNVYQQGTYAPDTSARWMGSVAMDKAGGIAVGFSQSSSTTHPAVHYTGRLAADPVGTMTQGEGSLITGAGSQTAGLSRWGDYSAVTVDPIDGCTFWYTNEYIPANGSFNWKTRIGSFQLPGCAGPPPTGTFSITASPTTNSAVQGTSANYTIATATTTGAPQSVNLSATGLPSGATTSFNPTVVTSGGASTMTVNVGPSTPTGTYTLTITGTGPYGAQSTTVTLNVNPAPPLAITNGGFETGTLAGWTTGGVYTPFVATAQKHAGAYSAQLGASSPPEPSGDSSLSQQITVPNAGTSTLSFWYWPSTTDTIAYDWQEAQIRNTSGATLASVMKVDSNARAWTQVTYDLTSFHNQTVVLWFNVHGDGWGDLTYMYLDDVSATNSVPTPPDFTITASPSAGTAAQGGSSIYTINTTQVGSAGSVSLSAGGLPSGVTASFNPTTVTQAVTASDFGIGSSPANVSVLTGSSGTSTVTTTATGTPETISLSATGQPSGTTVSFNPTPVTAGNASTVTFNVGASTATGSYPITITGTGNNATHTTTVTLTVPDFTISPSPSSSSAPQGGSSSYTINTTAVGGAGTVSLSSGGLPSGVTASFNPTSISAGASSTMTISVGSGATPGTYAISVIGTEGATTHSTTVTQTVTAAPVLSLLPSPPAPLTAGLASAAMTVNRSVNGSPYAPNVAAVVTLTTSSAAGRFDTSSAGTFTSSTLTATIPPSASSATYYYRDTTAGTPTITANASVLVNGTVPYNASGKDAYSNPVSITPTWTVSPALGTFAPNPNASTTFTATVVGNGATVTATSGSVSGTATLNVTGTLALSLLPSPPAPLTAGVASAALTVNRSANGSPYAPPSALAVTLTSTSPNGRFDTSSAGTFTSSTLTVTIPPSASSATYYYRDTTAGTPTITANASGYAGGSQVQTVNPAALATITVTPGSTTVAVGGTVAYSAAGKDIYLNPVSITPTWTVSPALGTFSPNPNTSTSFTATVAGSSATVRATVGSVFGTATVSVTPAPPPAGDCNNC